MQQMNVKSHCVVKLLTCNAICGFCVVEHDFGLVFLTSAYQGEIDLTVENG